MFFGTKRPKRVAVFISGSGSTLQTVLDQHHELQIELIVTNKKSALGVLKAKRFGKKVYFFAKDQSYNDLQKILDLNKIDSIFLAGFMKILPADFIQNWQGRILNIHPSLLPRFPGLDAAKKSYDAGEDVGVSIHEVTEVVDEGRIYLQMNALRKNKFSKINFEMTMLYLRRTEQHLLREVSNRWNIL